MKDAHTDLAGDTVVVAISSTTMGRGDDQLGGVLLRSFLHTLGEISPTPHVLIFLNEGVKLVTEGSSVLDDLLALQEKGVELLACGTCLGHFGLKEKVAVGQVSNMYVIAETMVRAAKVVNL